MQRWRAAVLCVLAGAAGLALSSCGSSNGSSAGSPKDTTTSPPVAPVAPEGFGTAEVVIRRADGTVCRLCTYLARTSAERQRGLMDVTDLAGLDGMLFDFDGPSVDRFWMRNTVMPLTAVWFAPGGLFVDAEDMTPCPDSSTSCPTYGPGLPADYVLELQQGDDKRFGIGAGSVLESVGSACEGANGSSKVPTSSR